MAGGGAEPEPLVAAAALLMQDAEEKPDGAMEVRHLITVLWRDGMHIHISPS